MSFALKSTHVDRDDFDADHYADFIRDAHRSRLTLDQLDITYRHLRTKEKLLTHIHGLRMKEHTRIKNDFIRKIEQDECLSNLPSVKANLKVQRRIHLDTPVSTEVVAAQQVQKHPQVEHSKNTMVTRKPDSLRAERLKANLNKFNHTNTLLD